MEEGDEWTEPEKQVRFHLPGIGISCDEKQYHKERKKTDLHNPPQFFHA